MIVDSHSVFGDLGMRLAYPAIRPVLAWIESSLPTTLQGLNGWMDGWMDQHSKINYFPAESYIELL